MTHGVRPDEHTRPDCVPTPIDTLHPTSGLAGWIFKKVPPVIQQPHAAFPQRSRFLENRLRNFRAQELSNRRIPSRRRQMSDLASRLAPMAIGYFGLLAFSLPVAIPFIVLFALATVSMLGSWYHDAVHGNIKGLPAIVSAIGRRSAAPVGFSPKWWSYKHVRLHHKYVSNPRYDPDIQFGYIARVSPSQAWRHLHATQHIHMWLLFPFAAMNMLKPSELWYRRRFTNLPELASAPPGWVFLADKYLPFLATWSPIFIIRGAQGAEIFVMFELAVGILVSLVTQVQHNTALSEQDDDFSIQWPLCEQLVRTTDVGTSPGIWWWLCGGANLHAAHHIAPTLTFLELPGVTSRLRSDLLEVGLKLPEHRNIISAIRSHGQLLRFLASRPGQDL